MENKQIISINQLLLTKKLNIPDYQRPYKWNVKNISDLLEDIDTAISEAEKYKSFKYRIGTIIIHKDNEKEQLNIVDRTTKSYIACITRYIFRNYF